MKDIIWNGYQRITSNKDCDFRGSPRGSSFPIREDKMFNFKHLFRKLFNFPTLSLLPTAFVAAKKLYASLYNTEQ